MRSRLNLRKIRVEHDSGEICATKRSVHAWCAEYTTKLGNNGICIGVCLPSGVVLVSHVILR